LLPTTPPSSLARAINGHNMSFRRHTTTPASHCLAAIRLVCWDTPRFIATLILHAVPTATVGCLILRFACRHAITVAVIDASLPIHAVVITLLRFNAVTPLLCHYATLRCHCLRYYYAPLH